MACGDGISWRLVMECGCVSELTSAKFKLQTAVFLHSSVTKYNGKKLVEEIYFELLDCNFQMAIMLNSRRKRSRERRI